MRYSPLINKVLKFVYNAHEGQVDKSGVPYVFHPFFVANLMCEEDSVVTALLHDVLEDTDKTVEDIRALGVSEEVIEALLLLTHDDSVAYLDYVKSIKNNRLARLIKLGDLEHNLIKSRLDGDDEVCKTRRKRYLDAMALLQDNPPKQVLTDKPECVTHEMKLDDVPFEQIERGQKSIEVRLFDEKRRRVHIGDDIVFSRCNDEERKLRVKVTALHCFDTFNLLFENCDINKMGFNRCSINDAVRCMRKYYSKEEELSFGVVGIEFVPVQVDMRRISGGACFLVRDLSLTNGYAAEFVEWLKKNGFNDWKVKGHYDGVDWIYVNIETKVYAFGMPGVPVTKVVCNHAVTIEEFKTLYDTFSKYEGSAPLDMQAKN